MVEFLGLKGNFKLPRLKPQNYLEQCIRQTHFYQNVHQDKLQNPKDITTVKSVRNYGSVWWAIWNFGGVIWRNALVYFLLNCLLLHHYACIYSSNYMLFIKTLELSRLF